MQNNETLRAGGGNDAPADLKKPLETLDAFGAADLQALARGLDDRLGEAPQVDRLMPGKDAEKRVPDEAALAARMDAISADAQAPQKMKDEIAALRQAIEEHKSFGGSVKGKHLQEFRDKLVAVEAKYADAADPDERYDFDAAAALRKEREEIKAKAESGRQEAPAQQAAPEAVVIGSAEKQAMYREAKAIFSAASQWRSARDAGRTQPDWTQANRDWKAADAVYNAAQADADSVETQIRKHDDAELRAAIERARSRLSHIPQEFRQNQENQLP